MQTGVGSVTRTAREKATHQTIHVADSMAESEGGKPGKGNRSGGHVCFPMLLNPALDLRGRGLGGGL